MLRAGRKAGVIGITKVPHEGVRGAGVERGGRRTSDLGPANRCQQGGCRQSILRSRARAKRPRYSRRDAALLCVSCGLLQELLQIFPANEDYVILLQDLFE